jgi:DNA-binding LacI/PurR family transcriptional regulator
VEGQKIKNMDEFAAVSGISRPTVSKYFNDPNSVRRSTREKIEAALERHSYRPNLYAINQNRRATKTVGIVVPFLADPFFAELARLLERLCIATGFRPITLGSHGETVRETENLDSLRDFKPAGVLLAPLGRASDRDAIEAFCADFPTVLFDSRIEGLGEAFVGSNNDQSFEMLVDYLCRTGEPPCLFEMRTPSNPNAHRRHQAYVAAMRRRDLVPQIVQAEGQGWDFEEIGYREGLRAISQRLFATNTVLCSNDRLAIGFLAAAYEKGLRVGRYGGCALRVAGHDDHPFARFTCPSLTTVSQNYAAIAEKSLQTLLARLESGDERKSDEVTLFDGRLVMRESA